MTLRGRLISWSIFLASVITLGLYAFQYPLNHDVGWFMHVARSILDGETLYRDIIEVNPPLFGHVLMVPLLIADLTGLPGPLVARACIFLICVLVLGIVHGMIRRTVQDRVAALSISLIVVIGVLGLPGLDFGQREHLMYVLVLPYLVLDAYRSEGRSVQGGPSIAAGIAAGIGIALKPHFAGLWLLYEGALALLDRDWKRRLRRPELVTVVVFGVAYATMVLSVFPEYVGLLWKSRHLYSAFGSVDLYTLLFTPYTALVAGVGVGSVLARRAGSVMRPIVSRLIVFAAAAWITALIQGKGWPYHFYPAYAAAVTGGLILSLDVLRNRQAGGLRISQITAAVACGAVIAIVGLKVDVDRAEAMDRRSALESHTRVLQMANAESFVMLSPLVSDGFPLANYTDASWTSPFSAVWWLQHHHGRPSSSLRVSVSDDAVEATYRAALVNELSREVPDIIFVDTAASPRFSDRSFPYVDYLLQEPRFRDLWKAYTAVGASGRFKVYERSHDEMPEM